MPRKVINPGLPSQPFSKSVRAGDFVYISGQMGMNADGALLHGDIETETRQTMENLKTLLAEAGCTLDDVVKCTCWLDDARDFARFNKVYTSYFNEPLPARSCVESRLVISAKVEVEAIAYKPID